MFLFQANLIERTQLGARDKATLNL